MPTPHDQYDQQIEELSSEYAKTALVIAGILATLGLAPTPSALRAAQATIQAALTGLLAASVEWMGLLIPIVYRTGVTEALKSIEGPDQDTLRERVEKTMRSKEHREIMQSLAETLRDDLAGAVDSIGRDAGKTLAEIRRRNVQAALSKGSLRPDDFADEMRERGVAFTDRRGRRWDAGRYASMVLRTQLANTMNAGHLTKAIELGSPGVRIFDGGPGDVDEPCKRANGQVWSLRYFSTHLIEHPNCRRSGAGLPKTWKGELDRV